MFPSKQLAVVELCILVMYFITYFSCIETWRKGVNISWHVFVYVESTYLLWLQERYRGKGKNLVAGFRELRIWYIMIYPSQRQNLHPTLEIITHNFQKFQKNQNFGKQFQNLEFFFQNFQNHKGAANDIKGAAASLLVNSKISIFNWELP